MGDYRIRKSITHGEQGWLYKLCRISGNVSECIARYECGEMVLTEAYRIGDDTEALTGFFKYIEEVAA